MGRPFGSRAFRLTESKEFSSTVMTSDSTAAMNVSASSLFTKASASSTKWSKHFQNPLQLWGRASTNSNPICAEAGQLPYTLARILRVHLWNTAGHQLPILRLGKHFPGSADKRTVSEAFSLQLKHHPRRGVTQIAIRREETGHGSG